MATEIVAGSTQEVALQNALQSKLIESGFISGDDFTITEYIVLLVANGKTQDEILGEVADTLEVGADEPRVQELIQWLFDQMRLLTGQASATENTQQDTSAQPQLSSVNNDSSQQAEDQSMQHGDETDMQDVPSGPSGTSIPTGPKSMRNGPRGGGKRILGHVNRAMDRTNEHSVHRIKGTAGTGRINTHHRDAPRGPTPKGPRNQQQQPSMQMQQQLQMAVMQNNSPVMNFTPEQQMQMYHFYEQQARMMAGLISPEQAQQMFGAQAPFNGGPQQPNLNTSKSLFDRVNGGPRHANGASRGRGNKQNGTRPTNPETPQDNDTEMATASVDGDSSRADSTTSICRYNNFCTKADCPYAHQSPAAPPNTTVDMTDDCSFGAACMNRKCVGKHPSPAKRMQHKSEQTCKYFPNCTNLACPFVHPTSPPCRNGADCTVPGCMFAHSTVACKFNPCLNSSCQFKHAEGQKRGKFSDRVWINPESGEGEERKHVSERTFVNENAEEELILPAKEQSANEINGASAGAGESGMDAGQQPEGVVT